MTDFNLADSYRSAGLAPRPEIMTLRQAPFEALAEESSSEHIVTLVRLHFGLAAGNGVAWFRDAFAASDPTFSMIDNEREIAVLAACVLGKQIADNVSLAAIAITCAAVQGLRAPLVAPGLVVHAEAYLSSHAVATRRRSRANLDTIKLPGKSKIPTEAASLAQAGDWSVVANLLARTSDESTDRLKTAINQIFGVIKPMAQDIVDLREEVAMLWWHIGGWSRLLDAPFAGYDSGTAAILAGIDLADLAETIVGPVAVPAMLQRTIANGRKGRSAKIAIVDAVNGLKPEELSKLEINDDIADLTDLCPVLAALDKAAELQDPAAWPAILARTNRFDTAQALTPLALGRQCYWERQLLAGLA